MDERGIKKKKYMNFYFMIPSVYFSPVMFISGELFKEGPVRVCYRTQSMHSNKEGILLLFVCMCVTRSFLDTLARMVSLKKMKIHHEKELCRICNT